MDFVNELNSSQRDAVLNTEGPALVIAGAGSGKTRVLTYRITQLLKMGVPAYKILALTFTNKAAREMKVRIAELVGEQIASQLWMGTFHSIFSKILRFEAKSLGYTSDFSIYDTSDSKSLIKSIVKEMNLNEKVYKANVIQSRISMAKNNLVVPDKYRASTAIIAEDKSLKRESTADIYSVYQQRCKQSNTMDFDDLLLQTNILFRDHPDLLAKYQDKFTYILVDEYQDTNYSQYVIVKKLAAVHKNVCVVGDDAQSIYSFRGAKIENILNFKNDYPEYKLYRLEQNYRSTTTIVDAANSIIAKNKGQIPKRTFSENERGDLIKVLKTLSDKEEGMEVSKEIYRLVAMEQESYSDFAILYRTNAQSRAMEEALRRHNIPYVVYGGMSFYQRKEIKDVLAYFRMIVNPYDEEAFKRIINYPKRGIGSTTVDKILNFARVSNASVWSVISRLDILSSFLNASTTTKISDFGSLIQNHRDKIEELNAFELAKKILYASGIYSDLGGDQTPEGVARRENVDELMNSIQAFCDTAYNEDSSMSLSTFIENVALLTDQDSRDEDSDRVTLMTIHASKGLEFRNIFIVGLEEDLFPNGQRVSSPSELEEERRLFYVALTRAEKRVFLMYAATRYHNGQVITPQPSRFIADIDQEFLDGYSPLRNTSSGFRLNKMPRVGSGISSRPSVPVNQTVKTEPIPNVDISKFQSVDTARLVEVLVEGDIIMHGSFGVGKVISIDGIGSQRKAKVAFKDSGVRVLLLKFARLMIYKD